jgi:hypothetical protein
MAAAQASAFQNSAPISRRHAFAKTMHAHTAADLRLVRTFHHFSFLTLKITASSIYFSKLQHLQAGLGIYRVNPVPKTGRTLYRNDSDSVNFDLWLFHGFLE